MQMFETLEPRQLMSSTWGQYVANEMHPSRGWQSDTNRDGRYDTVVFDRNRDGVQDAVRIDTNGDGWYDMAAVDTNLDGRNDVLLFSSRGNNVMDVLVQDTNRNGAFDGFDAWYADYGRNGTFSSRLPANTGGGYSPTSGFVLGGGRSINGDPVLTLAQLADNLRRR